MSRWWLICLALGCEGAPSEGSVELAGAETERCARHCGETTWLQVSSAEQLLAETEVPCTEALRLEGLPVGERLSLRLEVRDASGQARLQAEASLKLSAGEDAELQPELQIVSPPVIDLVEAPEQPIDAELAEIRVLGSGFGAAEAERLLDGPPR